MWDFLARLFARPKQDVTLDIPTMELQFNHRLRIALLFTYDQNSKDSDFVALENHLARRGYILQVVVASANTLRPIMGAEPLDIEPK